MFFLFSLAAAQILNLPQVTVNISTCEREIEAEDREFDLRCFGTSQRREDILSQFCKPECIATYDRYVNKIKEVCDLTPQDLTVLEQDIQDFNQSQRSVCDNSVNVVATAVNTAPGVTATVAPTTPSTSRPATASATTAAAAPAVTGTRSVEVAYPTVSPTTQSTPRTTNSAERVTVGLLGIALMLL
jgi:hypothetical protein